MPGLTIWDVHTLKIGAPICSDRVLIEMYHRCAASIEGLSPQFADRLLELVFTPPVCGELLILEEISNSPHTGKSREGHQQVAEQ